MEFGAAPVLPGIRAAVGVQYTATWRSGGQMALRQRRTPMERDRHPPGRAGRIRDRHSVAGHASVSRLPAVDV